MSLDFSEGTTSQTSLSMLEAARENDPGAWRRIVDTYSRRIYRWCRQAQLSPEDASDVVQEVFRAVARKLVDFHHERQGDTFRGWLYRITQNKIRDHFRRRSGSLEIAIGGTDAQLRFLQLEDPEVDGSTTPQPHSFGSIQAEVVRRVQAEFSRRDWLVFWRIVVDGQTSTDAGQQFGMTSNAVRLVKMRVLRRFRELMETVQQQG
jgi:RNA polymerase sigma-70 factor (ECF subfamily)